ncbi:hypothetical protein [Roseomonas haemaphysalidis]|uniref:Uncharacterized protein n=1 Tax=Roseomonas haemaphysalidis TaxID=2768162 RepID=A0ABS3KZ33_9PROT|nr:hypothetical protein [Roseomonas haemaphysalidis]MBO1081858.1 hypothetical protein [Roseomonas haemaphysalidis]
MSDEKRRALIKRIVDEVEVMSSPRSGGRGYLIGQAAGVHVGPSNLIFTVHDDDDKKRSTSFQITISRDLMLEITRAMVDEALGKGKPRG